MGLKQFTVYLSSTRHLVSPGAETMKKTDVPVCSCIAVLDQSSKKIDKNKLKSVCRDLSKYVCVDIEKRRLVISGRFNDPNTALIEYDIKDSNTYGDSFLERWVETRMLGLEYNVYDKKEKYLFTFKGLWDDLEYKWHTLRVTNTRTMIISEHELPETFISKD